MSNKSYSGDRIMVLNYCQECGSEAYALVTRKGRRAVWQCRADALHLRDTRRYELKTKTGVQR